MKKKVWVRLVALFLSVVMVASCLPLAAAANSGSSPQAEALTAMAQLGTDANYDGEKVALSNALYTFTKEGEAYTVSSTVEGIYLKITTGDAKLPNKSTPGAITVEDGVDDGYLHIIESPSYLYFWQDGKTRFDRASYSASKEASYRFALFCLDDTSVDGPIPGYTRLASASDVQDGGKYLIAATYNDNWYVLYPSDTTDPYAHVAKVVLDGGTGPVDPPVDPTPEPTPPPAHEKAPAPGGQPEGEYTMPNDKLSGTSSDGPMNGDEANSYFRIPALVTLPNGWIVAASDARWPNTNDSPNNLDTIVSVSKDGGKTWDWDIINYFADFAPIQGPTYYPGVSKTDSASFIDPALVVDSSGKLWMAVDLQPPNVNLNQNAQKAGSGFDENGWLMVGNIPESQYASVVKGGTGLTASSAKTLAETSYPYRVDLNADSSVSVEKNGKTVGLHPIFHRDGKEYETGYYVDAFFDLWYDYGETGLKPVLCRQKDSTHYVQSNLFYIQSDWKAYSTSYLMIRSAEVDEASGKLVWSDPILFGNGIKEANERFLVFCPGRGTIVPLENGGERIMFQLYDNATGAQRASAVYSDDGGKTWTRGERTEQGVMASESQVVLLPNGDLRMYSRNDKSSISYSDSSDNGATWSASKLDTDLAYCSNCMVSFINLDGYLIGPDNTVYENLILASYPKASYRSSGVIRIGSIGTGAGQPVTWLNDSTIRFPNRYNYSCLTQLLDETGAPADSFAVLYEQDSTDSSGKGIMAMNFVKMTAEDLLGPGWVLMNEIPEAVTLDVDDSLVDIMIGESKTIAIEYTPADAKVLWTSSDETIATVSADGAVTGVSAGKAVVTVSVTKGSLTRTASVNVLVQNTDGSIILPDEFLSGLTSVTVPGTTQYVLDEDGIEENIYIIYAQSGNRVMHNNTNKNATDHCTPSFIGDNAISANHANDIWKPTDDLWRLVKQDDGSYFIQSVTNDKFVTATASGSQLAIGDAGVPFTITHQGSGVYHIQNGDSYLAFSGGWKMQSTAFEIRLFGEHTTQDVTTYTVTADGLKILIRAMGLYEANYADVLDLAGEYDNEADALAAQAKIDEASKVLYAQYRTGNTTRYTVTYQVNGATWGVQSYYVGQTIVPMTGPKAEDGYVFAGWKGLPEDRVMPSHDLTLEAVFEAGKDPDKPDPDQPGNPSDYNPNPAPVTPVTPPTEEDKDAETLQAMPFTDVVKEAWYAQAIANVTAKGLIAGVDELSFAPKAAMTRGVTVLALYNLAEKPETQDYASFLDLADGASYADAVSWGAANGVIQGYSENTFGGENALTREQLATLLYRYAKQIDQQDVVADTKTLEQFLDGERVSKWAEDAMAWAVSNGLLLGRTDGNLDPRAVITRAEAAVILDRYAKLDLA